jgi:hypothetical protein
MSARKTSIAAVEAVGDRSTDRGEEQQRHGVADREQADLERRPGQRVELERDRDERDHVPEIRDRLAAPEQAEVARLAERSCVDGERAQPGEPAGPVGGGQRLLERRR